MTLERAERIFARVWSAVGEDEIKIKADYGASGNMNLRMIYFVEATETHPEWRASLNVHVLPQTAKNRQQMFSVAHRAATSMADQIQREKLARGLIQLPEGNDYVD